MTTKSDKIRGLFLSALMVMSVVAGTAAFAGTAAANHDGHDAVIGNDSPIFQGQIALSNDGSWSDDSTVELRSGSPGGENSYEDQLDVQNGHVAVDTSNLEGNYYLTDGDTNESFEVVQQSLSVSTETETVNPGDDVTIDIDDSNRNNFGVQVTSESFDAPIDNASSVSEGGSVNATIPSSADAGNYTLNLEVNDTTASDSVDVTVEEEGDSNYGFANAYPATERGDVAAINVSLENTESAYVQIGSADVSYQVNASVTDGDGDGYVTVLFNTYATQSGVSADLLSVADSDDDVGAPDLGYAAEGGGLGNIVEAGEYELSVYDGEPGDGGQEQAFGTLNVNERSTDAADTWTAPAGTTLEDKSDVYNAIAEDDSVAMDDIAVAHVEATGIYGYLDYVDDATANTNGLNVSVLQTNEPANADPNRITSDNYDVITDAENNSLFVVIDTSAVDANQRAVAPGQNYQVAFSVNSSYATQASGADTESVNTTFDVVSQSVSYDTNDNGVVEVPNTEDVEVTGSTSLAPGTQFRVSASSTAANLLQHQTVTVQDDGTWSATFDFSDVENGTEFQFVNGETDSTADALVNENAGDGGEDTTEPTETTTTETTTTETTTTETTTTETTTETETTETTETTTPDDNGGGIPGFGVSVALVAIIAAALLALRRSN